MLTKKTKSKKANKGIAFIEILIYTLVLSVSLLLVTNLIFFLFSFWQESQSQQAIISNSRFINRLISRDLRQATLIIDPVDNQYSQNLIIMVPDIGQLTYSIVNESLYRNSELISTDDVLVLVNGSDFGWRKIGRSIDWRMMISSVQEPLNGLKVEGISKNTIYLNNLP